MFNIEKLNVQDEIPSGAIRFDIKKNDGTVLYSNVDITMITEILQKGTALNKAFFDKIDFMGECIQTLSNVGEDIKKFILYGEYENNLMIYPKGNEEYIKVREYTKDLQELIKSLDNRVSALENVE